MTDIQAKNGQLPELDLLTARDVRGLAQVLGLRPTKSRGQNFVIDPGTVRKIAREAEVQAGEFILEVGPGLGSLTLALLERGAQVAAVEIDEKLAGALPQTLTVHGAVPDNFAVTKGDALHLAGPQSLTLPAACARAGRHEPEKLVANLPYNVAVPVLLQILERFPTIHTAVVMVQLEVAERLAATPGSKVYGAPSAKAAWYARVRRGSKISRSVFWPVPRVDSALVIAERRQPGELQHQLGAAERPGAAEHSGAAESPGVAEQPGAAERQLGETLTGEENLENAKLREATFAVIDAAFAQRRKTLRAALATWAGSREKAEEILVAAGIDPGARGETLSITDFLRIARTAGK
ncbi:16S rRNA (adenine(1518)-N(6)/adenine(1519)-N(6))-dimethyltransferase RsmA [Actinobaculum suis]|uniref:16S rRNA (adenine(1518)-N(6)/adenine(1519)-N(6))- dimethyltransferase RsmA n=1 Tax=Actinobaculum suis TaxID=1657 RepID=UPI00066FD363|nr:16S rRNA (adenine(1518)-N(6)/adenine(1519)-N(6))-dimethyltransferase RsmA [Actinobaculum suis]KMY22801.1 hypothetical protein ACU19_08065 [Actinobaculum suis]OCA93120.1 hypothetical protein ACU21_01330 [Actinobaculum suis]OCA93238.1 hypothetical protein ACU20_02460 [Actinobaculum suis]